MGTGHRIPLGDIANLLLHQWGSSQDGTPWGNVGVPMYKQVVLDSQTTVSGSGVGSWMTGLGYFKQILVHVRLSAVEGTSPTINMFVDTRLDGTNVTNLVSFPQLTNTATAGMLAVLNRDIDLVANAAGTVGGITSALEADVGTGTVRTIGWGDDLRIRRAIAGTSPSYSYIVTLNCIA